MEYLSPKSSSSGARPDSLNNFAAIDWNQYGTIAFSNGSFIHIIDSYSLKVIQSIYCNRSLSKLKWSSVPVHNIGLQANNEHDFKLAGISDHSNVISIWNVKENTLANELFEQNEKSSLAIDLKWTCSGNLIVLYSDNKLKIWDVLKGTKLFERAFAQKIEHFALQPYSFLTVAAFGSGAVTVLEVDTLNQTTKSKNSYVRSLEFELKENDPTSSDNKTTSLVNNSRNAKTRPFSFSSQCFQIEFHPHLKNTLILGFARELVLFDYSIGEMIESIQIDKSLPSAIRFYACLQTDAFYLLHENGSITFHIRSSLEQSKAIIYSKYAQLDQVRLSKSCQLIGFVVCPLTEKYVVIVLNDGRVLRNELLLKKKLKSLRERKSDQASDRQNGDDSLMIGDLISELKQDPSTEIKLTTTSMHPILIENESAVVKMSPYVDENEPDMSPVLAFGSSHGVLHLTNKNKSRILRKYSIFSNPIVGIEWYSKNSIFAWSHTNNSTCSPASVGYESPSPPNTSTAVQNRQNLVRNEIVFIDLRTGESIHFRKAHDEESAIVALKSSNLKQYLVILFKEQPLEIWDLQNFSLIKRLSKRSPTINILEWFLYDEKALFSRVTQEKKSLTTTTDDQASSSKEENQNQDVEKPQQDQEQEQDQLKHEQHNDVRESFICIDHNEIIYSFKIESNHIRDAELNLPDNPIFTNVRSVDIKGNFLVLGDSEGHAKKWNFKTGSHESIALKRSLATGSYSSPEVKKVKFSPKKDDYSLLVQFNDRIEFLNVNTLEIIASYRNENVKLHIAYAFWCGAEHVFIYFTNGMSKIFDIARKQCIVNRTNLFSSIVNSSFMELGDVNVRLISKLKHLLVDLVDDENRLNAQEYLNSVLRIPIEALNSRLVDLLTRNLAQDGKSKLSMLLLINFYFNSCSFETRFWSLMAYNCESAATTKTRQVKVNNEILLNPDDYRSGQFKKLELYQNKQEMMSELTKNSVLIRDLILLDQTDPAFNLLVETESKYDNFAFNLTKAGLVTTLKNVKLDPNTQTSLKLIGANLIANGKFYEGIELLCLIGLVFDACRYLQDHDYWEKAAWLAKTRLNNDEYNEVIKRWCEYLCSASINQKEYAILLLISCKLYVKAVDILAETEYTQLAYIFLKFTLESNLIGLSELESDSSTDSKQAFCYLLDNKDNLTNKKVEKILHNYLQLKTYL